MHFQPLLHWFSRLSHRILHNRRIRFTRFGTYYILFSIAVGAAAINTGNNLLYLILGILLGFIIVSGFLSDSGLWGIDAHWEAVGDFYAGEAGFIDLTLKKTRWPGICVYVESRWLLLPATRNLFYWISRSRPQTRRLTLTPPKRGHLRLQSARFYSGFPFGLFEKSHEADVEEQWIVYPQVKTLALEKLRAPGTALSDNPFPQKGSGSIPFDLREFHPGDPIKQIHWKASAKHQRLIIKEMEKESDLRTTLVIRRWPEEKIEEFISFVASLLLALYQNGLQLGLQTPSATFPMDHSRQHLKRLFTHLALLDPSNEGVKASSTHRGNDPILDAVALWERYRG